MIVTVVGQATRRVAAKVASRAKCAGRYLTQRFAGARKAHDICDYRSRTFRESYPRGSAL